LIRDRNLIERIRTLNSIKGVVEEVIPLRGNVGRCPRHDDKHPSFSVDPKRGLCRCWAGCTDGSLDIFGFCEWYYGDTFPEAIGRLAGRVGMGLGDGDKNGPNNKRDPSQRLRDLLIEDEIQYQRWKREILKELGILQATLSQRLRNRIHRQYAEGVLTEYGLERKLLALERVDEEFDRIQ
jgi:DNA primase